MLIYRDASQFMKRGEVWWARVDERCPVVFLASLDTETARAILVVPSASRKIDQFIEIEVGEGEGLGIDGVVRIAFPKPDFIPCTWITTLSITAFLERAGRLSPENLHRLDAALQRAGLE
jgi:mRNA interferase MazF